MFKCMDILPGLCVSVLLLQCFYMECLLYLMMYIVKVKKLKTKHNVHIRKGVLEEFHLASSISCLTQSQPSGLFGDGKENGSKRKKEERFMFQASVHLHLGKKFPRTGRCADTGLAPSVCPSSQTQSFHCFHRQL